MLTFKCTLCGKCCEAGGPELTIKEALRFGASFPLAVRVVAVRQGRNPDVLIKHVKDLGFRIRPAPPGKENLTYFVYGNVFVTVPEGRPCPALRHEKCSLHPDKPLACAAAPFAAGLPPQLQKVALDRWSSWECCGHAEGELIYDDERIVSSSFRRDHRRTIGGMKSEQHLFASLLERIPKDILVVGPH
ncbi:MAG: hypothetical protein HOH61_05345 [Rhodospirillaceae bacterium]|jgi:Fe-S-cluster containining protein|nr:hypothetical protein [Rhodospirillaceae bacterium]MBT5895307.1 hypothetical protein [Rhodospirillaceae bacterium]